MGHTDDEDIGVELVLELELTVLLVLDDLEDVEGDVDVLTDLVGEVFRLELVELLLVEDVEEDLEDVDELVDVVETEIELLVVDVLNELLLVEEDREVLVTETDGNEKELIEVVDLDVGVALGIEEVGVISIEVERERLFEMEATVEDVERES